MQRGKAGVRVEHAQLVQMELVLSAEQQLSLLLPYALPVPAHGGSAQQRGKHPGGDEQRQGEGGQGSAGYRRQQQAERQRDAAGKKNTMLRSVVSARVSGGSCAISGSISRSSGVPSRQTNKGSSGRHAPAETNTGQ